jgi:hypothetical protein
MSIIRSATAASTHPDAKTAVREAWAALTAERGKPSFVIAIATVEYRLQDLVQALRDLIGDIPLQGGTSCGGVMTDQGFFGVDGRGLALFGFFDEEGQFGVGVASIGETPREAGAQAMRRAMSDAGRDGEMPAAVWMITTPGGEEEVVRGVEDVVGPDVPLVGGSAADNTIAGNWRQFSRDGVHENSVSILALYPSGRVSTAFHCGYDPTTHMGTITRADGRTVHEIDGLPASHVYNKWTGGALEDVIEKGGELLARTNLQPLGRQVGEVQGIPYFVLTHPERAYPDGSMHLFTDVTVGERFVCMTGSVNNLVGRAANVVRSAMRGGELTPQNTAAGLMIFCGGCFLTVQTRIDEVHRNLAEAMGGQPFIAAFTFGEQGRVMGAGNRHGNLMISTLLLAAAA